MLRSLDFFLRDGTYGRSCKESGVQPDKVAAALSHMRCKRWARYRKHLSWTAQRHWQSIGRPRLENPGAGWNLQSVPAIADLPEWVSHSQPSHFELAYLGQQMWPNIERMLAAMTESVTSPK